MCGQNQNSAGISRCLHTWVKSSQVSFVDIAQYYKFVSNDFTGKKVRSKKGDPHEEVEESGKKKNALLYIL